MSDLPQDGSAAAEDLDLEFGEEPGEEEELLEGEEEGEAGAEEGDGEPGAEEPLPAAARRQRPSQSQRLRGERDRLLTEMAELRGRFDQMQRQSPQPGPDPRQREREEAEFYASLDTMTPAEAVRAAVARERQLIGQTLHRQQTATEDRIDKQGYDAQKATSAVHRQYADRVEQVIATERARGNFGVTRDAVLRFLVGDDAISRANASAGRQRTQAARRVQQQRVPPTSGRGDGARSGARAPADSLEAARERIRNKPLW